MIVIGYLNLHDGELLLQEYFKNMTPLEAMNLYLETDFKTLDEVYDYCHNSDSYISYLEI